MTHNDRPIKVVVETVSEYRPKNTNNNGISGEFGEININTGTSVKLKFTLKDQATDTAITIPGFIIEK